MRTLYSGKFDVVELGDGRVVIRHPGAVAALVVLGGKALLVEQFRPALGRRTLEIPAGTLKRGEGPEEALRRELVEEIGHEPIAYTELLAVHPAPGYSSELLRIYYVWETRYVGIGRRDVGEEDMSVVEVPVEKLVQDVVSGRVDDGKTVLAVLAALARGFIRGSNF